MGREGGEEQRGSGSVEDRRKEVREEGGGRRRHGLDSVLSAGNAFWV